MTTEFDASPETIDDGEDVTPSDHPAADLRAVVVTYEARPNRCTICPRSLSKEQLTTAWLTADASAFMDLAEAR